jgi:uncharacterized protein YndB with AHSA1/START domain
MILTAEAIINAPIETVWEAWISPEHIKKWNFASDDWHCPHVSVDFRVGGEFTSRMEAKDGSIGFDLKARYSAIEPMQTIKYIMEDQRSINIYFSTTNQGVRVIQDFEAEKENEPQLQQQGWQAILESFKRYVEAL